MKDLGLSTRCSGVHKVVECKGQSSGLTYPCTICNSKQHISAVCVVKATENNQLQSGLHLMCNNIHKGQSVILPSMSVIMHVNNGEICERVRCMIDMGSQASYISEDLATRLGFKSDSFKTEYKVKTCIGVKERSYSSATCDVIFTPTATARHSFLVDPEMNLEYEIPGIKSLVQTLKANGVRMADSFFNDITSDTISDFDCLLGSDIIGALKPLKSVDLGMGTALEVQDGLILFGDVDSYLNRRSQDEVTGRDESVDGHQGPDDRDASEPAEENNEGFGGLQRGKPSWSQSSHPLNDSRCTHNSFNTSHETCITENFRVAAPSGEDGGSKDRMMATRYPPSDIKGLESTNKHKRANIQMTNKYKQSR